MKLPVFPLDQIKDQGFRSLMEQLREYLLAESQLQGFKFYTVELPQAQTNFKFAHDLGYQPKDVLPTSVTNGAVLTWAYDKFTGSELVFTVDKACTVRFFAGTYDEVKS